MTLLETTCCWRWVEDSAWEGEWGVLLKSLGELSQHLCLASSVWTQGGCREWTGAGKGHQTEQRTVPAHPVPHLNPTASQHRNNSNSTGIEESFTSLFPIILTVKDTNASWESKKKKLNTSLSPALDLLSWRSMAITNAFSCSPRNTHSAKGLSQLSAGYWEGWFPPAELHWCSCLQRSGISWPHKLAERNHSVPLQWFGNIQM